MGESREDPTNDGRMSDGKKREPKKRLLLRIEPGLHDDLRAWAEDDFRSINAQIEFLLKQAVAKRKRSHK
jgi:hypothetical protein